MYTGALAARPSALLAMARRASFPSSDGTLPFAGPRIAFLEQPVMGRTARRSRGPTAGTPGHCPGPARPPGRPRPRHRVGAGGRYPDQQPSRGQVEADAPVAAVADVEV